MTGAHRAVSPDSRRPTTRILVALFMGSAVVFTAAVVQGRALFAGGDGAGAGPRSEETAPWPSPETAATPQDGALRTAGDDGLPVIALQSEGTAAGPSPRRIGAGEASTAPDAAVDQPARWAPGTPPDWEASVREALARQAPAPAAPTPAAQHPPASDGADEPDNSVVGDLLDHLGTGP